MAKKRYIGDCVAVYEDFPPWLDQTELVGVIWEDSNPHGARFKQIKRKLGKPSTEWGEPEWGDRAVNLTSEEWSHEDTYGDQWELEWPDGVVATLYFRRGDSHEPGGEWKVGARKSEAKEALKRVRALLSAKSKSSRSSRKPNPIATLKRNLTRY